MLSRESKITLPTFTVLERAVTYARVSGDDRLKDGRNLAGQSEMCREYAHDKGYTIVEELAEDDRGASGYEIDLPQLNKIRHMARNHKFDVLIVREMDRLSRNLAKQLIVEEELRRYGVRIEYVLAEYQDTPEGRLNKYIRATIAEYEREKISERMTRGRQKAVKEGNVIVHRKPPFGYRVVQEEKKAIFEINNDEAAIVRLIFHWYVVDGESIYLIKQRLVKNNVSTPSGTGEWSTATVHRILKTETYCGTWHYGKKKNNRPNDPEHWIGVSVPAIVDRETWELAHVRLEENKVNSRRNLKHEYLLSKRVVCQCGYKMSGRCGHNKYRYYYCPSGRLDHSSHSCTLPHFRADKVDAVVWDWVKSIFIDDDDKLEERLKNIQSTQKRDNQPLLEHIRIAEEQIAENEKRLDRLVGLYLDGSFAQEALIDHKSRIEQTLKALEVERSKMLKQLQHQTLTDQQINSITHLASKVKVGLVKADQDFAARRKLIELLDVRATLKVEDNQKIVYAHCYLGDDNLPIELHNNCKVNWSKRVAWQAAITNRT